MITEQGPGVSGRAQVQPGGLHVDFQAGRQTEVL